MDKKRVEIKASALEEIKVACLAAIVCLDDWIETTGFGTVNRRDRQAREFLKDALNRIEEVNHERTTS